MARSPAAGHSDDRGGEAGVGAAACPEGAGTAGGHGTAGTAGARAQAGAGAVRGGWT